jgi:hypothetical protein
MRNVLLSLMTVFAVSATAAAEPAKPADKPYKVKKVKVRSFNAAQARIACTNQHQTSGISCDGIERYRSGMGTVTGAVKGKKGVDGVMMYQVASRPSGGLVLSQAIAAVGVRKVIGRGYVQAGPGIARMGTQEGPRSIGTIKTFQQPRAAVAGGVGMNLDTSDDPATLAIDFGTTIDSKDDEPQIYQVGASVSKTF